MKRQIIIGAAVALAAAFLMPGITGADEACPPPAHPIYDVQGNLLSCEEEVGAPESCPDDTLPGYLASGELAGCFERSMFSWYEVCYPDDADTDGDGRGDACDPCPLVPDCDSDSQGLGPSGGFFRDGVELFVGTDALDNCADTATANDERGPAYGEPLSPWPPDFNDTGKVTVADAVQFRQHFEPLTGVYDARYDLNASGAVTPADLVLFAKYYGTTCTDGAAMGALALGAPTPDASAMGQWDWWLPLNEQVVHQHSVHRWCWWDLEQGWWQCEDKYWVHLAQTFYWCELGAVTVGPHTVDYGAVDPFLFLEGDTWYTQSIYSQTHVRGLAGMEVRVQRGEVWDQFPAETWIDYYESRPYEAGESGFLEKGALDPDDEMGHYSYEGGSSCLSDDDRVDPISVVFYGGYYTDVEYHACDHGDWCYHTGDPQMFWSHGCWEQDGQANSEDPPLSQYHMRILTGRYWDGTYAYDPVLGVYNLTTPHHEDWGAFNPACGTSGHSVYDNEEDPPGGFIEARQDIVDNWVVNGPHKYGGWQFWNNTEHLRQSRGKGLLGLEGCWYAWNDGYVEFISLEHEY